MFKRLIVLSGILSIPAVQSYAGTITTPDVLINVTTSAGSVLLQQFDPSLGTLTGVTLNIGKTTISDTAIMSDVEATNVITITYNLGHMVTFTLPGGGTFVPLVAQNLTCSGVGNEFTSCSNLVENSLVLNASTVDLTSAIPGSFLGLGTFAIPYSPALIESLVSSIPSNPSNLSLSVSNLQLTSDMSVTYTFTDPVGTPEPGSLGAAGLGLGTLVFLARKRFVTK